MLNLLKYVIASSQWIEARKGSVRDQVETFASARRCPNCRREIKTVTPLFGFGCARSDESADQYPTEIPRRPYDSMFGSLFF